MELELSIENRDTGEVNVQRLPLEDRIVLGRGPESPVLLDGPLISRDHIAFERKDGQLWLHDLSSNGSWLNGELLASGRRYPVSEADRIQVPGYELQCTLLPSPGDALPAGPAQAAAPVPPANVVKEFLASVTGQEMVVLLVFVIAVAVTVVFWRI